MKKERWWAVILYEQYFAVDPVTARLDLRKTGTEAKKLVATFHDRAKKNSRIVQVEVRELRKSPKRSKRTEHGSRIG